MQIAIDQAEGIHINDYQAGCITINATPYRHSVLITENNITQWPAREFSDINAALLIPLFEEGIEVILIGCGTTQQFLSPELLSLAGARRIGMEIMTTASACRTFNVLRAEGRKVIAALIV